MNLQKITVSHFDNGTLTDVIFLHIPLKLQPRIPRSLQVGTSNVAGILGDRPGFCGTMLCRSLNNTARSQNAREYNTLSVQQQHCPLQDSTSKLSNNRSGSDIDLT